MLVEAVEFGSPVSPAAGTCPICLAAADEEVAVVLWRSLLLCRSLLMWRSLHL